MINIPCSFGELVDKVTILDIKLREINDNDKLKNIQFEHELLTSVPQYRDNIERYWDQYQELLEINSVIWHGENSIRILESRQDFGSEFVTIARNIRAHNDQRSRVKKKLNLEFGSNIIEEKSHREI